MLEEPAEVKKMHEVRSANDIRIFVDYILRVIFRNVLTNKKSTV